MSFVCARLGLTSHQLPLRQVISTNLISLANSNESPVWPRNPFSGANCRRGSTTSRMPPSAEKRRIFTSPSGPLGCNINSYSEHAPVVTYTRLVTSVLHGSFALTKPLLTTLCYTPISDGAIQAAC